MQAPAHDQALSDPRFWSIAAAAVLLEHALLRGSAGELGLSRWAASLLSDAAKEIVQELRACGLRLSCPGEDARVFIHVDCGADCGVDCPEGMLRPASREDLQHALVKVCEPLKDRDWHWLASLRATVQAAATVLQEEMDGWFDVSGLRDVTVGHAVMFGEPWSTPYEVCWQADGAGQCITMPDVSNFSEQHFEHFARRLGHMCPGQTLLFEYLATMMIPCHEIIHILQHLHGHLQDPDPQSYAMEHDASRINFVLLWHALQCLDLQPAWAKWVVMLEGMNSSLAAEKRLRADPTGCMYAAYRKWADSFGLESPSSVFRSSGDEEELALEAAAKNLIASEALLVGSLPPSREDLTHLLRAALCPDRKGDVYSADNRRLVAASLPEGLRLDSSMEGKLLAGVADQELAQGAAMSLRHACEAQDVNAKHTTRELPQ